MSERVKVQDKTGKVYEGTPQEAAEWVKTGVYTYVTEPTKQEYNYTPKASPRVNGHIIVYSPDGKTHHSCWPIDAEDLIKQGWSKEPVQVTEKQEIPNVPVIDEDTDYIEELPVLTEEHKNAEIKETLEKYGVDVPSNTNKAEMLAMWEEYKARVEVAKE